MDIIQTAKEFIERYVCIAGEMIAQLSEKEWEFQRWTARTFKIMGSFLVIGEYDVRPPQEIIKLKPKTRRESLPMLMTLKEEAIHKGWLAERVRKFHHSLIDYLHYHSYKI